MTVGLTELERALYDYFIAHPGEDMPRDVLLRDVWGYADGVSSRTVDVFVGSLRKKVEPDPSHPTRILTVRGVGYRFEPGAVPERAAVDADALPLVGRDDLLERMHAWRAGTGRLLTLVGPLGVGKSRLARAFARAAGVAFADLERENAVPRADVVVLDHVDLAGDWARRAVSDALWSSETRVVLTARRPLRLQHEEVLRVGPLEAHAAVELDALVRTRQGRPAGSSDAVARFPFQIIRDAIGADPGDALKRHRSADAARDALIAGMKPDVLAGAHAVAGLGALDDRLLGVLGVSPAVVEGLEDCGAAWRVGEQLAISPLLTALEADDQTRLTLATSVAEWVADHASSLGAGYLGLSESLLEALLDVATDPVVRGWLLLARFGGDLPAADHQPLRDALVPDLPDALTSRLTAQLVDSLVEQGDVEDALAVLKAYQPATAAGSAELHLSTAWIRAHTGDHEGAEAAMQSAIGFALGTGDTELCGRCFNTLGLHLAMHRPAQAIDALRVALTYLQGAAAVVASCNLASLLDLAGERGQANEVLQAAGDAARTDGARQAVQMAIGRMRLTAGELDEAEVALERALTLEGGSDSDRRMSRLALAIVHHLRGDVVRAMPVYREAAEFPICTPVAAWWEAIAWGDLGLAGQGLARLDAVADVLPAEILQSGRAILEGRSLPDMQTPPRMTVAAYVAVRGAPEERP